MNCPTSDASAYGTLADCQRQWITDGKGDHKFDVVVTCSSLEHMPREIYTLASSKIRLQGGSFAGEGRVEVYRDGVWNSICGISWDLSDAR